MSLDRELWKAEFTATSRLPWTCAGCDASRLQLVRATLHEGQTKESREEQAHIASEPEWIDGRFVCMLKCPHCDADVAVAGTFRVQDDRYYDDVRGESGDYESYYRPSFFSEAPAIIRIPDGTHGEIAEQLTVSFRAYWGDKEACGNHIRSAVEHLLTAQRIPRTVGRRKFLPLHDRIERFRSRRPELADALLAVKWIGNAGSHTSTLTADDLLDGYEMLGYVLDEIYLKRARRVGAIARAINRRRGPRSRRRPQR